MTIYVDKLYNYGKAKGGSWCHMWCDNTDDVDELNAFAESIGLKPEYIHWSSGISGKFPHYDLKPYKREKALKKGAQEKSLKEWVRERMKKNGTRTAE